MVNNLCLNFDHFEIRHLESCLVRHVTVFSPQLCRDFDATKDFGKLLGLTLQLLDGPVRIARTSWLSQLQISSNISAEKRYRDILCARGP